MSGGCGDKPTPKERGFFRIAFPKKEYQKLRKLPFYSFEIPRYAKFREEVNNGENIWQNIHYPKQNGQLHLTYFHLKNNLAEHIEDTHKFVYKHTIKADAISPKEFSYPERSVFGMLYDIEGQTASSVQFFVTDSVEHFLRGSLYLNERPNKDSLSVVIQFLRADVVHLMETLEWK